MKIKDQYALISVFDKINLNFVCKAFNQNNINAVMNCFDKQAIFDHAAGQDIHGTRYEGHEALRKVFETLISSLMPDSVSSLLEIIPIS